jgi:hypothetical protein
MVDVMAANQGDCYSPLDEDDVPPGGEANEA